MRTAALALLALVAASACATYSDRTRETRGALDGGDYARALDALNAVLGVDGPGEQPERLCGERPLALLERAVLLQALGDHEGSARDFELADRELELLDLTADPLGETARYLLRESAPRYRTTPTEKLALNALNLANYLARNDLEGAAVEARRFTVMRTYLEEHDPEHAHGRFGSYLAGVVFERRGEWDRALRYYDEALAAGELGTLREPVARLARRGAYRGRHVARLLEAGDAAGAPAPAPGSATDGPEAEAEVLVLVALGRVPGKVPRRIPIGRAIAIAGAYATRDLSWLARGALKVVSYADLAPARSLYSDLAVRIDGRASPVDLASDLGAEIRREYEALKPRILAAALARLAVRAAAAEGARLGMREGADADRSLAWLVALLTEGALLAADRPDTRSWSLLPQRVFVARRRVAAGRHEVSIELSGLRDERRVLQVEPAPGELATVVWTVPR